MFDGYEGTSTKDMTLHKRVDGRIGATVTLDENMAVVKKKADFPANNINK